MAQVTFKLSELDELIKNRDSGVTIVRKCVRQLFVSPFQLQDLKKCVRSNLYSTVAKFDPQLDGIILSYKRIKIDDFFSIQDDGRCKFCYIADIYVFKPKTGSILSGIVNKKGSDHLGCLVHRVFNIAIPRPESLNDEKWIGSKLQIGQEVQFKVIDVDLNEDMPYIKGELIDQPGIIYNEDDVNELKNENISNILQDNFSDNNDNEDYDCLVESNKVLLKKNEKKIDNINTTNEIEHYHSSNKNTHLNNKSDKLEGVANAHNVNISMSTATNSPKKYQKQNKLISNTLNDMYMRMSKLNTSKGNQDFENSNDKIRNKENYVSKDVDRKKDKKIKLSLQNDCSSNLNNSNFEYKNLKKDKRNKSLPARIAEDTDSMTKSSLISIQDDLLPPKKKKKKRQSFIDESEIQLEPSNNNNGDIIYKHSRKKEFEFVYNNNLTNVNDNMGSKQYLNAPERNASVSLNCDNIAGKIKENNETSSDKKRKKRKSILKDEFNNSTSDQIDGFQQLKQTVSDIFAESINLKNNSNSNFSSENKTTGLSNDRYYLSDSNLNYKNDDKLEVYKKKKKKHKEKDIYSPEGHCISNKNSSNLSCEENHLLSSLTDSEYVLKESKRKKKGKKDRNYFVREDFDAEKSSIDRRVENESDYKLYSLNDSECILNKSSKKKKKRSKEKNVDTSFVDNENNFKHLMAQNDIVSGFITDTEIVLNSAKKKTMKEKKEKKRSFVENDFTMGSVTDTENLKRNKKKPMYDLDTIRQQLMNDVFKTFKTSHRSTIDNADNIENRSEELCLIKKDKKYPKEKKRYSQNSGDIICAGNDISRIENIDTIEEVKGEKNISVVKNKKRSLDKTSHEYLNDLSSHKKKKRRIDSDFNLNKLQNELLNNQIKINETLIGKEEKNAEISSKKKKKHDKDMKDNFKFDLVSPEHVISNEKLVCNSSESSRSKQKKRKSKTV